VQFAAENEKRFTFDDELSGGAAFLEVRCGVYLCKEIGIIEAD
jgi:hypothetical protein